MTRRLTYFGMLAGLVVGLLAVALPVRAAGTPAASAFEKFRALEGDWIDLDGTFNLKDKVAVSYRLTGNGSAVIETMFVGTPHEMTTVYHRDGNDLVLTHYCAGGNQPRMRAKSAAGNVVAFEFDGGTNMDPAKDEHMHSARFEFVSPDEIRGEWFSWAGGKPNPDHVAKLHLGRRK